MAKSEIEVWLETLGANEEQFYAHTGLKVNALNSVVTDENLVSIEEIQTIFIQLESWFDSRKAAWQWFIGQRIAGFGNLTPAQVISQHGREGTHAVELYIESKELGSYE